MFDGNVDVGFEKLFPGFDTPSHWTTLRERAAKTRQWAEGVARRYDDTISYSSIDQIVRDEIVAALRAGEESEIIYWKLRYFAEAYRHSPVIQTDKGKVLYVIFDRQSNTVSLVIGELAEMLTVGKKGNRTHYVMPVTERYDYVPYDLICAVARRHLDCNTLIDELAPEASVRDSKVPVLIFSLCERGREESEAILSCDLSIADPRRRFGIDGREESALSEVAINAAPASKLDVMENPGSKIVMVVPKNPEDMHYRTA